jgi:hypothetical protein
VVAGNRPQDRNVGVTLHIALVYHDACVGLALQRGPGAGRTARLDSDRPQAACGGTSYSPVRSWNRRHQARRRRLRRAGWECWTAATRGLIPGRDRRVAAGDTRNLTASGSAAMSSSGSDTHGPPGLGTTPIEAQAGFRAAQA